VEISRWWSPSVTTGTGGKIYSGAPEGRQTEVTSVAPPGLGDVLDCVRWFLHRLISGVPPGQRVIPDLRGNLSMQVCTYGTRNCKPIWIMAQIGTLPAEE
jgi:hypothetical protein